MFKIKKILFPVDFSKPCEGALRYVESFAGRFQAELKIVHVVDLGAYAVWGTTALWGAPAIDMSSEGAKWAREEMKVFLEKGIKYLNVTSQVLEGDPGIEIVAAARDSGADLIMIPTHGLSVFRRYILGSITAKILHDAECAVWTGAHLEDAPPLEEISFRKVMCAIDMGPQSEKALRWAAGFAKEHGAELIVANIVPAAEGRPAKYFDRRFVAELSVQMREEVRVFLEELGIEATIVVEGGDPAKTLSEIAQTLQVDQLVIARGVLPEGLGRLRTQAYAIIRSAPCPVVSV
jgi:nucleotide-binding universal stress UspA family protein